jgi:tetratricopeptide (TPR) repeat protein
MRTKEYDEAIRFYTNSVNYDPSEPTTYCNRALAYIKKLNYQKGLKDCEEALRLKFDYSKAYYRKAICLIGLKRFPEALEDLLYVLKDSPSNEEILNEIKSLKQKWKESLNSSEEWSRLENGIDQDIENAKINKYQFKYISLSVKDSGEKNNQIKIENQDSCNKAPVNNSGFKKIKITEEEISDDQPKTQNNMPSISNSSDASNQKNIKQPVKNNTDTNKQPSNQANIKHEESGENITPHLSKKFFT